MNQDQSAIFSDLKAVCSKIMYSFFIENERQLWIFLIKLFHRVLVIWKFHNLLWCFWWRPLPAGCHLWHCSPQNHQLRGDSGGGDGRHDDRAGKIALLYFLLFKKFTNSKGIYYYNIKRSLSNENMTVLTSLKWFSPREWSNWYEGDWVQTQRPCAQDNADYRGPGHPLQTTLTGHVLLISILTVYSLKSSTFCHFYSFKPETCLHIKTANTLIRYVQWGSLVYLSHECFHVPHPITHGLAGPTGRSSLAGPIAHTVEAQPLPTHVLCTPHNTLHSPPHID